MVVTFVFLFYPLCSTQTTPPHSSMSNRILTGRKLFFHRVYDLSIVVKQTHSKYNFIVFAAL